MLDEASRKRRLNRALDALEADNFQEDPHGDLKANKKAPKFDENLGLLRSVKTGLALKM